MSDLNDPRVFFAAERTLLAWNRTSLTLMAFGFVIERFGLFVRMLLPQQTGLLHEHLAFWIGLAFIALGSLASIAAVVQYQKVLTTLNPIEIPEGYWINSGVIVNASVAILGAVLTVYLFLGHSL
jgi:putative membrane protein